MRTSLCIVTFLVILISYGAIAQEYSEERLKNIFPDGFYEKIVSLNLDEIKGVINEFSIRYGKGEYRSGKSGWSYENEVTFDDRNINVNLAHCNFNEMRDYCIPRQFVIDKLKVVPPIKVKRGKPANGTNVPGYNVELSCGGKTCITSFGFQLEDRSTPKFFFQDDIRAEQFAFIVGVYFSKISIETEQSNNPLKGLGLE